MISAPRRPARPPRRRAPVRRRTAVAQRLARDAPAAASLRGCGAARPPRPPRPQSLAAARRPHTLQPPPPPPWALEVPHSASLAPEALRGAAAGSRGRGAARFWRGPSVGCPVGHVDRGFPGVKGAKAAGLAEQGGSIHHPAHPALHPLPVLQGRPWVCPGPLHANVAAPAPGV